MQKNLFFTSYLINNIIFLSLLKIEKYKNLIRLLYLIKSYYDFYIKVHLLCLAGFTFKFKNIPFFQSSPTSFIKSFTSEF
jgi:hypothetical protein